MGQGTQGKFIEAAGLAGSSTLVYSEPLEGRNGPHKFNSQLLDR
jgi:hypothetical protein